MTTWTTQPEKEGGDVATWADATATWGGVANEWDGNASTIWTKQDDEATAV